MIITNSPNMTQLNTESLQLRQEAENKVYLDGKIPQLTVSPDIWMKLYTETRD